MSSPALVSSSQLTQLRLEGFKNFAEATIPLGPFTVLVGTNASGKSNLRDALRFLHGVSRGYNLAEIVGEKWVEGGVLQWRGIRGGTREAAAHGSNSFALEVTFVVSDAKRAKGREVNYRIEVDLAGPGRAPRVVRERLIVEGRGQFVYDSHPDTNAPTQTNPMNLTVRLRKEAKAGYLGPTVDFTSSKPVLSQIPDHPGVKLPTVKELARLALQALGSMRFLDLAPDAMRIPSLPGQLVLGDRGENLSSVLLAICADPSRKEALLEWVRALTPLDARDFEFPADQTGRVLVTLVEHSDRRTSAYSASDGTLRFLAMVAALMGEEPARFYFFEELENGIHPARLHLLVQLIEQKAADGIQLVATSHSPQLLSLLSPSSLDNAVLIYRLSGRAEAQVQRITDIPRALELIQDQSVARLYGSGWLEDAVTFLDDGNGE